MIHRYLICKNLRIATKILKWFRDIPLYKLYLPLVVRMAFNSKYNGRAVDPLSRHLRSISSITCLQLVCLFEGVIELTGRLITWYSLNRRLFDEKCENLQASTGASICRYAFMTRAAFSFGIKGREREREKKTRATFLCKFQSRNRAARTLSSSRCTVNGISFYGGTVKTLMVLQMKSVFSAKPSRIYFSALVIISTAYPIRITSRAHACCRSFPVGCARGRVRVRCARVGGGERRASARRRRRRR